MANIIGKTRKTKYTKKTKAGVYDVCHFETDDNQVLLDEAVGDIPKGAKLHDALERIKNTVDTLGKLSEDEQNTIDAHTALFGKLGTYYDNIIKEHLSSAEVNVQNGGAGVNLTNNPYTIVKGKSYYVYVNFTIRNLTEWVSGLVYFRLLYTILAPSWSDHWLTFIADNGTYTLCYNFTADADGQVIPNLLFNNQTPTTNNFSVKVNKLFLIESSEDLKNTCDSADDGASIFEPDFKDGSVTEEKLADDVKAVIPHLESNNIDCWGDSLTLGSGSDNYTYPSRLQELVGSKFVVTNYGHGGETAVAIAFRQGGILIRVNPFSVANNGSATIHFKASNGMTTASLYSNANGTQGIDNITIDGMKQSLMFRTTEHDDEGTVWNYTGKDLSFDRPVYATAQGGGLNHIMIICIGQNGLYRGAESFDFDEWIEMHKVMIEHNNCDKYIVFSMPTEDNSTRTRYDQRLGTAFGKHFVNVRLYISEYGLSDSGLTPTDADREAMAKGAIPPQLLVDGVHFNSNGYKAMGNCVYQKGKQLGYWE